MKIHLIDVGRNKFNGTIECPNDAVADEVAKLVFNEARGHMLSTPIVTVDLRERTGIIYAGFHVVGKVKIE